MVQTQREFIADASHELRTPLTSILANLELLQAQLDDAQRQGEEGEIVGSRAPLVAAHGPPGLGPAPARPRRRRAGPGRVATATSPRSPPRRCRRCGRSPNGHELVARAPEPVPVEGNPDELHRLAVNLLDNGAPPHARGHRDRRCRWIGERRCGPRGDRRRSRPPAGHGGAGLRPLRPRLAGRPTSRATRAPGLGLAIVEGRRHLARRRASRRGASTRRRGPLHGATSLSGEALETPNL